MNYQYKKHNISKKKVRIRHKSEKQKKKLFNNNQFLTEETMLLNLQTTIVQ